ncbi:MAG TPA: ferritin-like domain-containing protein [Gaiellaceae bacterium]|nr:ferritin-like domain-containing protein [Gaiellaceae bacterium]
MPPVLTRSALLSSGVKRGAALVVASSMFETLAGSAAADPLPDGDLAFARLLVGAELLAADFYTQAIAAKQFGAVTQKYLAIALQNEQAHYQSVSLILSGAGQTPAVATDFNFSYPGGSFGSRRSIATLGGKLEAVFLGAYLGAIAGIQTPALAGPLARIAASESQHLSLWETELDGRPLTGAFPAPITIEQVSDAMDAYTS